MRRQKKKTSHKEVRCPEEPAAPHYSDTTCVLPQLPSQRPDRLRRFPPFRRFPHSAASLPLPWGAAGGRPLFPPTFPLPARPALPAALSLSVCRWCCESRAGSRGLGGEAVRRGAALPASGKGAEQGLWRGKKKPPKSTRSSSHGSLSLPLSENFGFEKGKTGSLVMQDILPAAGEGEMSRNCWRATLCF